MNDAETQIERRNEMSQGGADTGRINEGRGNVSKGIIVTLIVSGLFLSGAIIFGFQPVSSYDDSLVCYPTRCFKPYPPGLGLFIMWLGLSAGVFIASLICLITEARHTKPDRALPDRPARTASVARTICIKAIALKQILLMF